MFNVFHRWYKRKFSDPDAAMLLVMIILSTVILFIWGKMMMPGFVESHFHTTLGAAFGQGLWMAHLDEKQDFLDAIKQYVNENTDLTLIMGFGWKPYAFPPDGPVKADLDAISTEKPIFLFDVTTNS